MRTFRAGPALAAGALLAALPSAASAGATDAAAAGTQPRLGECGVDRLCLWERPGFKGARHTYELSGLESESCVPLPRGTDTASFANRTGRPVTVYQSRECAETQEFHTHPSGSWTPEAPYQVRAFKMWER